MPRLNLEDIVNELELISDEGDSFLNTMTGQLFHLSNDELRHARDETDQDTDLPDWQQENIRIAKEIARTTHYLQLPTKDEIDEFGVMEKFCSSFADDHIGKTLYRSLKGGNGAKGKFREVVARHALGAEWYAFKREAFRQIALDWCNKHTLDFV